MKKPTLTWEELQTDYSNSRYEDFKNLGIAVVTCAVSDWKEGDASERRRIERFFKSEWYTALCDLNPDLVIRELRQWAKENKKD